MTLDDFLSWISWYLLTLAFTLLCRHIKLIRSKERQLNSVMDDMVTYIQEEQENLQSAAERDWLQIRQRKKEQAQNVERAWMRIQGLSTTEKTRLCPICLDENAVGEDASLNGFCC